MVPFELTSYRSNVFCVRLVTAAEYSTGSVAAAPNVATPAFALGSLPNFGTFNFSFAAAVEVAAVLLAFFFFSDNDFTMSSI